MARPKKVDFVFRQGLTTLIHNSDHGVATMCRNGAHALFAFTMRDHDLTFRVYNRKPRGADHHVLKRCGATYVGNAGWVVVGLTTNHGWDKEVVPYEVSKLLDREFKHHQTLYVELYA